MTPQEKNNRKTSLLNKKNVSNKKVGKPKRNPLKKKASAMKVKNVAMSKKVPPKMKVAAKKVTAPQRTPLKKKVSEKKKSAKSSAKEDSSSSGLRRATSKSSDQRGARAAKRNLAKEASITQEPRAKRARRDLKVDLVDLLSTSDSIVDILAASGSQLQQTGSNQMDEERESYKLDLCLGTSGATIKDIMAASVTGSLTAGDACVNEEAPEEVMNVDMLWLNRSELDLDLRRGSSVAFDAAQDVLAACSSVAAANELTTLEEIIVNSATAPGGEDSKSLPTIVDHVAAASSRCHPADHLTHFEAQTKNTCTRKVFISPALLWLEKEGLPSVVEGRRRWAGVVELAFGAVEEEEMVRIALETWKKMSVEEKAFWRKKAKEVEGNIEK